MTKRSLTRVGTLVALAPLLAVFSCSSTEKRGQLMLALSADLSIPQNMNEVVIEVIDEHGNKQNPIYPIKPDALGKEMPGTIAIVPPGSGGERVRVRVIGQRNDGASVVVRVVREAVVTVPRHQIGMLTMPIRWLCEGKHVKSDDGSYRSDCADGETCVAGVCAPAVFDGDKLPEYQAARVYGGGNSEGQGGKCFDVVPCFQQGIEVVPDSNCTIPVPPPPVGAADAGITTGSGSGTGGNNLPPVTGAATVDGGPLTGTATFPATAAAVSVGMVPAAASEGHCPKGGTGDCYLPLDRDDVEGWKVQTDRIALPKVVCDRMGTTVKKLVVTTACGTKDLTVPLCGPWTNVTSPTPVGAPTLPIPGMCVPTAHPLVRSPSATFVLLDDSVQMSAFAAQAMTSVTAFAKQLSASSSWFGYQSIGSTCGAPPPTMAQIPLTQLSPTMAVSMPTGAPGQPDALIDGGLALAQAQLGQWVMANPDGDRSLLLITAGTPTCNIPNVLSLANNLVSTVGLPTTVISMNGANPTLDQIATAGGTVATVDATAGLDPILSARAAAAMNRCRFRAVPGEQALMRDATGRDTPLLLAGACTGGMQYTPDSLGVPGVIELCPAVCTALASQPTAQIMSLTSCNPTSGADAGTGTGGGGIPNTRADASIPTGGGGGAPGFKDAGPG